MPLRHTDPFQSKAAILDATVNPYVALINKAAEDGSLPITFGEALRGKAGTWRARLAADTTRLVVEIGCHKGLTLLEMAKESPDTGFLGVDITYKRVVTTAQRAVRAGLRNVHCVMANAVALDQLFAPAELDGVVMFFPDPWVRKKSQAKNRLVDATFCAKLRAALRPGGFFWFKTDHEPYWESTAALLTEAGFERLQEGAPFPLPRDYSSAFERRFHADGLATHGGRWTTPTVGSPD